MQVAINHLTNNLGSGTSINTATITPTPNRLILIAVSQDYESATVPNQPSVSGCNLTWELVTTRLNSSNNNQRISLFRAMGANPTSGVLTISFGGQSQVACFWSVDEFFPVSKTGANGVGAVVQSTTQSADTTDPMNMTLTLGAFQKAKNATYAAIIGPDPQNTPTGFTQIVSHNADPGPDSNFKVVFAPDNRTSINFTSSGGGAETTTALACEIKFANIGNMLGLL